MSSPNLFNTKTLFTLRDILAGSSLKSVFTSTDRVWGTLFSDAVSNLNNVNAGDEALLSARRIQEQSRDILLVLKNLTPSLEVSIKELEDRISRNVLRIRLNRLPDELLLIVLGYASSTFDEALQLSHICSRFRSVMLSCPYMWNWEVETTRSAQQVAAILVRSDNLPLRVTVSTYLSSDNRALTDIQRSSFENILSQSGRITELDIPAMSRLLTYQLLNLYHSLRLPALRRLSISSAELLHRNDPLPHFYASWTLPNLKHLEVALFTPLPSIATGLTSCHFKYLESFDIGMLTRFLGEASSLKSLSLEIGYVTHGEDVYSSNFPLSVINTSVVSFNLHVYKSVSIRWSDVCIRLSSVIDMSMKICKEATMHYLFEVPLLKNLKVEVTDGLGDLSFGNILRYAPHHLTSLSLMAPRHKLAMDWGEDKHRPVLPLLRTLRFEECCLMDHSFLRVLSEVLLRDGVEIEKVEVAKCREVREQGLRDAFPNSEVCWTPCFWKA